MDFFLSVFLCENDSSTSKKAALDVSGVKTNAACNKQVNN